MRWERVGGWGRVEAHARKGGAFRENKLKEEIWSIMGNIVQDLDPFA